MNRRGLISLYNGLNCKNLIFIILIVLYLMPASVAANESSDNWVFERVIGFRVTDSNFPGDGFTYLSFSKNNKWIAVGGAVLSINNYVNLGPVSRDRGPRIERLVFSPDGEKVLGFNNRPYLFKLPKDGFNRNYISEENRSLEFGEAYSKVVANKCLFNISNDPVCFAFTDDHKDIIIGFRNKVERWSDGESRKIAEASIPWTASRIFPLGRSGSFLLYSREGYMIWDGESITVKLLSKPKQSNGKQYWNLPAVSPDGTKALEIVDHSHGNYKEESVYIWDLKNESALEVFEPMRSATAAAFLEDGRYCLGYKNGRLELRTKNHKVDQVLCQGTEIPAVMANSVYNFDDPIIEIAVSQDNKNIATISSRRPDQKEVVLYSSAAKQVIPSAIPKNFPARPGAKWVFSNGSTEVAMSISGIQVVGQDKCIEVETYPVNKKFPYFKSPTSVFYLACRDDGLFQVDIPGEFLLSPIPWLPSPLTHKIYDFESRTKNDHKVTGKIQVKAGGAIDTPYGRISNTTLVSRFITLPFQNNHVSEELYLADNIGPVRLIVGKEQLDLKSFNK